MKQTTVRRRSIVVHEITFGPRSEEVFTVTVRSSTTPMKLGDLLATMLDFCYLATGSI